CLSHTTVDALRSFPGLRAVPRLYIWQAWRFSLCASSRLSPLSTFHAHAPVHNEDDVILHFVSDPQGAIAVYGCPKSDMLSLFETSYSFHPISKGSSRKKIIEYLCYVTQMENVAHSNICFVPIFLRGTDFA